MLLNITLPSLYTKIIKENEKQNDPDCRCIICINI